jgi:hypothetical protein
VGLAPRLVHGWRHGDGPWFGPVGPDKWEADGVNNRAPGRGSTRALFRRTDGVAARRADAKNEVSA